jgi:hypothetical protein
MKACTEAEVQFHGFLTSAINASTITVNNNIPSTLPHPTHRRKEQPVIPPGQGRWTSKLVSTQWRKEKFLALARHRTQFLCLLHRSFVTRRNTSCHISGYMTITAYIYYMFYERRTPLSTASHSGQPYMKSRTRDAITWLSFAVDFSLRRRRKKSGTVHRIRPPSLPPKSLPIQCPIIILPFHDTQYEW